MTSSNSPLDSTPGVLYSILKLLRSLYKVRSPIPALFRLWLIISIVTSLSTFTTFNTPRTTSNTLYYSSSTYSLPTTTFPSSISTTLDISDSTPLISFLSPLLERNDQQRWVSMKRFRISSWRCRGLKSESHFSPNLSVLFRKY